MRRWNLIACLILLAASVNVAQAATEFSCSISGVNADGQSINVSRTTCSAMVVYVNLETGEQQELMRSCYIGRRKSSCAKNYDDANVLVGFPRVSGIRGYSRAASISKFANSGCVQGPGDLSTDADDFGNQSVSIVQNMSC